MRRQMICRYEHSSQQIFVHVTGLLPPLDEREMITAIVRRKGPHYIFLTWEARGNIMFISFDLLNDFYSLSSTPDCMREDLRQVALETGVREIAKIDPVWIVTSITKLCGYLPPDLQGQKREEDRDDPPSSS